jgi:hypothetical protein
MLLEALLNGGLPIDIQVTTCDGPFERTENLAYQLFPLETREFSRAFAVCLSDY